ncbi:short-chain dehydrogenase [Periconia macrospinosa]|uniref:Short-chain dehydrogenase n=1 Tax=Periconia macrospinosa TaxID=97972 RepID=A0A2V1D8U8_9PLEO|nr:short-chain dehydrogenase [Periconia macrospinosa]
MADSSFEWNHYPRPLEWSPTNDLPNLAGKVGIVTGGNSLESLGGQIVYRLALLGAKVYVGGRSSERVQQGIDAILSASPSLDPTKLVPFVADLGNWSQVKQRAEQLIKDEDRLDFLINNGGVLTEGLEINEFGVNADFSLNHVAHFVLTATLLPLLSKTASNSPKNAVRIVNVSSTAHSVVSPPATFATLADWNNDFGGPEKNPYQSFIRYGFSKTANILFTQELQRRLDADNVPIIVTAPHPGEVQTTGAAKVVGKDSDGYKRSITPSEGALTPVWCAVSEEVDEKHKGHYIMPYGVVHELKGLHSDEKEAKNLWNVTEEVLRGANLL